jgi:putative ABC transport system permease protein
MLTSLSVGFETLRANPLRTVLSTLGIVIGVAALVAVLSVGDGMERLAREQIGRTTDLQSISVTPRMVRIVDGTPFPVDNPLKFTDADATSLELATDGARQILQDNSAQQLASLEWRSSSQRDFVRCLRSTRATQ